MVLSGKFYHDTYKIHWPPPPPPSLPPGEKRWQVPNKRLSTSSGTNASNHKVNSKNQPVQYGRTFQPVISKKKNDNWPWFNQESLAILEMKIDLSEKFACVKF